MPPAAPSLRQIRYAPWLAPLWAGGWEHAYLRGGRWAGRSRGAADYCLVWMRQRSANVVLSRQYQRNISESNYALMTRLIQQYGWDRHYRVTDTDIEALETGSTCQFLGAERSADAIMSRDNIGLLWFEQAETVKAESLGKIVPSIRPEDGGPRQFIYTWNPQHPELPIEVARRAKGAQDLDLFATWRDNPWLPDAFWSDLHQARRERPHLVTHVYDGQYRPLQGAIFNADRMVELADWERLEAVRGWDIAGSESATADRTAGARLARCSGAPGYCLEDAVIGRWEASERNRVMRDTALADGPAVTQIVEITGSVNASVRAAELMFAEVFEGLPWRSVRPTGSKPGRADPVASAINVGNVGYPRGAPWAPDAKLELAGFPDGDHDDFVDALAHAYNELAQGRPYTDDEFEVGIV